MVNLNKLIKTKEIKDLLALLRFSSRGSNQVILLHHSSHHQVIKTISSLAKDWKLTSSMVSKLMETVRKTWSSAPKDSIKTSSKSNQGDLSVLHKATCLILELSSNLWATILFLREGHELVEICRTPYNSNSSMEVEDKEISS